MKTKNSVLKRLSLVAGAWVWCALNLDGQSAPTITSQPAGRTNLAGTNVIFNVTVAGTGPFSYQWQFNGANLPNNIITTVAGNGKIGYSGDGGAATNASFNVPCGMAFDAGGNLYIADGTNNVIRKVDTNGIITTVAGTGQFGFSGNGGAATNANLSYPSDVKLDAAGNLYIADSANEWIRKVNTNGVITTVAGRGSSAFSGDGGAATNAGLNYPNGVAFDAVGNLYISDEAHQRIRLVGTNGIITTVAGNGSATYGGDGGAATNASLWSPQAVTLDGAGNLYIADLFNERVRRVDTNGNITTVAGNGYALGLYHYGKYSGDGGSATNASLSWPDGVVLDGSGNLYIGDEYNNRIRKVDTNGIITTAAGVGPSYPSIGSYSGDGGPATNANLRYPDRMSFDAAGNLYIADSGNQRIREVHFAGYPTLALTDVGTNNAGNYTVVVTSPYGSVTSAVAALAVTIPNTPPQIITCDAFFGFVTNQFGFNVSGATGQTIVVDGSTDLVNWTPLCTNTVCSNLFYFCDPAWTNFPWCFFRARLQ